MNVGTSLTPRHANSSLINEPRKNAGAAESIRIVEGKPGSITIDSGPQC
jgi:hypothetical protein